MKIIVATKETQGKRQNDFSFAEEGELLYFGAIECDGEAIDGRCGCRRSMSGLKTGRATTTFKVVETDEMTIDGLSVKIAGRLKTAGWANSPDEAMNAAKDDAKGLVEVANHFDAGDILERRGDIFKKR
jgi:hypothetical protein